jgi:hypothetical protein
MIHRAIYELLKSQHTRSEWETRKAELSIDPDGMISTLVYPDAQTQQLVTEAALLLGISPADFLQQLGRFWTPFAARGSYGYILDFTGKDLASFISGLDRMHQAVVSAMPHADVPSFTLVESRPVSLVVDYRSNRQGLEPFVTGLLYSLLDRFGHAGSVEYIGKYDDAARFLVRYGQQRNP